MEPTELDLQATAGFRITAVNSSLLALIARKPVTLGGAFFRYEAGRFLRYHQSAIASDVQHDIVNTLVMRTKSRLKQLCCAQSCLIHVESCLSHV